MVTIDRTVALLLDQLESMSRAGLVQYHLLGFTTPEG